MIMLFGIMLKLLLVLVMVEGAILLVIVNSFTLLRFSILVQY